MPHVTVHCRNCGTSAVRDITPEPLTPYVNACPDCPTDTPEPRQSYDIHIEVHDEEGPLTRLSGTFEAPSLAAALDDGSLAAALEPLWNQLQKTAHLAEQDIEFEPVPPCTCSSDSEGDCPVHGPTDEGLPPTSPQDFTGTSTEDVE